ncbi:MAG: NAD(P)H-dependent oxidoreductase subunit E [Burkholderiales bacterium]|nr:NAD(P)H-dependent oxidoreductase subunit E [Burkholderiales bacterium]
MNDRANAPTAVAEVRPVRLRATPRGRQADPEAVAEVQALLGAAPRRRDLLIEYLHRIQDRYGALADRHLVALARELKLSMAEVYEVATFYHHFDVVRAGEAGPPALTVRVCDSLPCELAGAKVLAERLARTLGPGVRVLTAPCIGRCETAPNAVVGRNPCTHATVGKVEALVAAKATQHPPAPPLSAGGEPAAREPHARAVSPAYADLDAYLASGGYRTLGALLARGDDGEARADVRRKLEDSGLRGLGGAGFPVGRKWQVVAAQPAPRLMAVNIDEGEPGTFKDRWYLERDPHRFLEGMLIAAWAVGIAEVWIYLRDEYHGIRAMLEGELAKLASRWGRALPPIELRRGAGAYICGEESAMIESIEGKRGMPRLRPPYVAEVGLFGRPTLEHNMESLYWVRDILEKGPGWFASQGRNGRKGLRSFSVSGRVQRPGVHLAPAGITVRELIDEFCGGMLPGHAFYAYLPGGASGGILPASLGDVPLDFDTLAPYGAFIGSAAIIVLSDQDRAIDAARNLVRFFRDESCGQCTPCRVGTAKALALIERDRWDEPLLQELAAAMMDASICGLGQAAPNPVLSVMKHFRHEIS